MRRFISWLDNEMCYHSWVEGVVAVVWSFFLFGLAVVSGLVVVKVVGFVYEIVK